MFIMQSELEKMCVFWSFNFLLSIFYNLYFIDSVILNIKKNLSVIFRWLKYKKFADFWHLIAQPLQISAMRFNNKELAYLAHHGTFDKQGSLLMKDKTDGLFKKGEGTMYLFLLQWWSTVFKQ